MNNYPPGVTGNEPQITGEWPCEDCLGAGYFEDGDGPDSCLSCDGSGIIPEDAWGPKELEQDLLKVLGKVFDGTFNIEEDIDGRLIVFTPYVKTGIYYRIER
jgi:hypothetical protein